eukprot:m.311145 g.311145  ORF g.311145 m.311145 type:complete len:1210 (+) comp60993_c0_seq1:90-3719(+)
MKRRLIAGAMFFNLLATVWAVATTLQSSSTSFLLFNTGGSTLKRFAFSVKTRSNDALLAYQDSDSRTNDYLLLRLVSGQIQLKANVNSQSVTVSGFPSFPEDVWHNVSVDLNETAAALTIDGRIHSSASSLGPRLVLSSEVYFGGIPPSLSGPFSLPAVTGIPRFVGCVDDVKFADHTRILKDVTPFSTGGVASGCVDLCLSNPCRHSATCYNFYSHYLCDCSLTGYAGNQCEFEAPAVGLQGAEYVAYDIQQAPIPAASFHMQARLRTTWPKGLILYSQSLSGSSWIRLELINGTIHFAYQSIVGETIHMEGSSRIDDNEWHAVDIAQAKQRLVMSVKSSLGAPVASNATLPSARHLQVFDNVVYVGGVPKFLYEMTSSNGVGFIGCLQQVTVNGIDVISQAKAKQAAVFSQGEVKFSCPFEHITSLSFPKPSSVLEIPQWNSVNFSLAMDFRTTQADGILFYSATHYKEKTFQAHFRNGHVHVESLELFTVIIPINVSDGHWHCLKAKYDEMQNELMVGVDSWKSQRGFISLPNLFTSLSGSSLFVGGRAAPLGDAVLPDDADGTPGFVGCVRNIKTDGRHVDTFGLLSSGNGVGVVPGGCQDEDWCAAKPCHNHGKCIKQYNAFACDCSKTSYNGTVCQYDLPLDTIWLKGSDASIESSLVISSAPSFEVSFEFKTARSSARLVTFSFSPSGPTLLAVDLILPEIITVAFINGGETYQLFLEHPIGFNDGLWKRLTLSVDSEKINMSLNEQARTKFFSSKINLVHPNWFTIGGASLNGLIGCIREFTVNGKRISLEVLVLSANGEVEKGCEGLCASRPCFNGGICNEEWGSFTCDCDDIPYSGRQCNEAFASARFDGGELISVKYPLQFIPTTYFHTTILGFSTTSPGTLLYVTGSSHFLHIEVNGTHLTMTMNIEHGQAAVSLAGNFTSGNTYGLQATHQRNSISLSQIGQNARKESATLPGTAPRFSNQTGFYIGGIPGKLSSFRGCIWNVNYDSLMPLSWIKSVGYATSTVYDGFAISAENVSLGECGPVATLPTNVLPSSSPSSVTPESRMPTVGERTEETSPKSSLPWGMIVGIVMAGCIILIVIIVVIIRKYKKQDEGSYSVNEGNGGLAQRAVSFTKVNPELTGITPYDVEGTQFPDQTPSPKSSEETGLNGRFYANHNHNGHLHNHTDLGNQVASPAHRQQERRSPPPGSSSTQAWFL